MSNVSKNGHWSWFWPQHQGFQSFCDLNSTSIAPTSPTIVQNFPLHQRLQQNRDHSCNLKPWFMALISFFKLCIATNFVQKVIQLIGMQNIIEYKRENERRAYGIQSEKWEDTLLCLMTSPLWTMPILIIIKICNREREAKKDDGVDCGVKWAIPQA